MAACTILIPTHNRQNKIKGILEYYKKFQSPIIVLDSSPNMFQMSEDSEAYKHVPGKSFCEKIDLALKEYVNTDLVALAPDDDYLFFDGYIDIVQTLTKNSNYAIGFGRTPAFSGQTRKWLCELIPTDIDENLNPLGRVQSFLEHYFQVLWSVHRVSILKKSFSVLNQSQPSNDNFIELTIAIMANYLGVTHVSHKHWIAREANVPTSWGRRTPGLYTVKDTLEFASDFGKVSALIDAYTTKGVTISAINSYFKFVKNKASTPKKGVFSRFVNKIKRTFVAFKMMRSFELQEMLKTVHKNLSN